MKIKQYKNEDLFRQNKCYLLSEEIHIWIIRWKEIIDFLSENFNIMSKYEKEQVARFQFYEDQMRCAAGKIVTRLLLAQYLEVQNKKIIICRERFGKPYHCKIDKKKSIHFNISHSGDIVLIGFSYFPKIGVDIERIALFSEYRDVARNLYAKEEILAIEEHMTQDVFYQYWTAKEAFLKATGIGLLKGMDFFSVENEYIVEEGTAKSNWRIISLEIDWEYAACIAVQKNE